MCVVSLLVSKEFYISKQVRQTWGCELEETGTKNILQCQTKKVLKVRPI